MLVVGLYSVLWGKTQDPKLTGRVETTDVVDIESDISKHTESGKTEIDGTYDKRESPAGHSSHII